MAARADSPDETRVRRYASDVIRLVVGLFVTALLTLAASRTTLTRLEVDVFRVVNDLPAVIEPMLIVVMQAGGFAAVAASTLTALGMRKFRIARDLAAGGTLAWLGAKLLKSLVGRDRPGVLLDAVVTRGTHTGPGFPSGHAAVAAALATALGPYVPRPVRRALWAGAVIVGIARMYVGAHLPLDMLGGWALGWSIGSAVHVVFGTEDRSIGTEGIRKAMASIGRPPVSVSPVSADARGSVPFIANLADGSRLFVKALSREERNADWLFKGVRRLLFKNIEDEAPFATPKQQLEHEAYVALLAARAGARVPAVVDLIAPDPHDAILAIEVVEGRSPADEHGMLTPPVLSSIWRQVALLHSQRIAHRDLRLANIVVSPEGEPWIVDFGFAEAASSDRAMALDVAELLVSLSAAAGVPAALDAATPVVGASTLRLARTLLQPAALSSATRHTLHDHPQLLQDLDDAIGTHLGEEQPKPAPIMRFRPRLIIGVLAVGFAIHVFLPQVGELRTTLDAIRGARWDWLLVALGASAATYAGAALSLVAACPVPLSYVRTLGVVLAASFTNRLAPSGLGRMGLDVRYVERQGASRAVALGTEALNSLGSVTVHITALVVAALVFGRTVFGSLDLGREALYLGAIVAAAALAGVAAVAGPWRSTTLRWLRESAAAFSSEARHPGRLVQLIAGAVLLNTAYILSLDAALRAVGADVASGTVALVYLGGVAIASASPTPGGLGAEEAALVAAFSASGVEPSLAVAGVLVYRLVTFWLPTLPGWFAFRQLRKRKYV